jgi:hypothetical protein
MEARALFPVVVKDRPLSPPPEADAYYVVAENGLFLVRRTPLFTAAVAVDGGVPGLLPHGQSLEIRAPRLPRVLVERAAGFFRTVYERFEGEGILVMFYAPALRRYALVAPPQVLTGEFDGGRFRADLRLDYGLCEKPGPEWVRWGTFHSHCELAPYHSQTDVDDEIGEPGLHVTAGYLHRARPEFAASFVVNATRFPLHPAEVLAPFGNYRRPSAAWLEKIVIRARGFGNGALVAAAARDGYR